MVSLQSRSLNVYDRNTMRTSLQHNLTQFEKNHRSCNTHIENYPEHFPTRCSIYSPGMDNISTEDIDVLHFYILMQDTMN